MAENEENIEFKKEEKKEEPQDYSDFELPIDNQYEMLRLLMKPDKFKDSPFHQTITKEFILSNIKDGLSRAKVTADFNTMMALIWHGSKVVWKKYHARMMATMLLSSSQGVLPWIEGSGSRLQPQPQQLKTWDGRNIT